MLNKSATHLEFGADLLVGAGRGELRAAGEGEELEGEGKLAHFVYYPPQIKITAGLSTLKVVIRTKLTHRAIKSYSGVYEKIDISYQAT